MGNLICKVWAVVSAACLFASCSSSIPQTTRQPAQAQTAPGKVKGIQQKCPQNNDPQPEYPNPQVTMGVVRAESTRDEICTPHFTEGLRAGKPTGPGDAAPAENNDEIAVTDGEKKIVVEKY